MNWKNIQIVHRAVWLNFCVAVECSEQNEIDVTKTALSPATKLECFYAKIMYIFECILNGRRFAVFGFWGFVVCVQRDCAWKIYRIWFYYISIVARRDETSRKRTKNQTIYLPFQLCLCVGVHVSVYNTATHHQHPG